MKILKSILLFAILALHVTACKKDDNNPKNPPPPPNDEEIITTLILFFDDTTAGNFDVIASFDDPDGVGGNPPQLFDTIRLKNNFNYKVSIVVLNKTKNPVDTISNEILQEAEDHQFFFQHTGVNITSNYADKDKNNLPIGLQTIWTTGNASSGTSRITLKHQPGIKNGTQAPGETDIELDFISIVQ